MVDHVLGFVAHCEHAMGRLLDGDNRGLVDNDALARDGDQCICSSRSMAISVDIWPVRPENMSKKDIQETLESRFQVKPNSSTGVDAMMKIHEGAHRASASPPLCLTSSQTKSWNP